MENNQSECLEQIVSLLTGKELDKLTQALAAIKAGDGWGDLVIRFKGGRVDTIEITSSILVRDKSHHQS